MRKTGAMLLIATFGLFLAINAYPTTTSSKVSQDFSLKENYETRVSLPDPEALREALIAYQEADRAESIKGEIARLKKTKSTNIVVAAGFIGAGAFLMYEFFNYQTAIRESQEGTTQNPDEGRSNTSLGKAIRLGGSLVSFIVSVVLFSDVAKKNKAIKSYKKELENLSKAQGR